MTLSFRDHEEGFSSDEIRCSGASSQASIMMIEIVGESEEDEVNGEEQTRSGIFRVLHNNSFNFGER